MGKYLIPAFPSHKSKDAARKYAFSMIDEDIERRRVRDLTGDEIKPVERISTLETALAAVVKSQNLEMSQFYPPLPEHIQSQRRQADLERYARHISKGNFDPYRGATEVPLGGRIVGD
ncbi:MULTISPECIES: hypothetical protein [Providencia]|uniref:hypothetical protein n=1 Tax=Providencia TaxID=586 RepID=UPI00198025D7|nr:MULTISPECIES: hypothetical protein [Providencia]MBN4867624.1 hypothetical protein [Providencia stuartii]MBN4877139.1 hypothetical protein [Providencia stuartii]MBN4881648.1 hypothetical protein [Providencia stuartii]MBN4886139.1 hypothetical protein [Providencia stuartii]